LAAPIPGVHVIEKLVLVIEFDARDVAAVGGII
jgi:hypothetical protein